MKVVLFLFAAILIMLCAALVCPVEINARARVKPRFGEVQADICVLGTIRIKADALAVWLPLEADIRINGRRIKLKRQRRFAQGQAVYQRIYLWRRIGRKLSARVHALSPLL